MSNKLIPFVASKKRKNDDVPEERPTKKLRNDFSSYDTDDLRLWASEQLPKPQADYIARVFTPAQLLATSEEELIKKHSGKNKLSHLSIGKLLGAILAVKLQETSLSPQPNPATPGKKQETEDFDLNTKEGVLNWLDHVVAAPPKPIKASDILTTVGGSFPHCVPQHIKQRIYRAALDCHGAAHYNKESLQISFINGAPGIGKTRMALETLNILKECAMADNGNDTTTLSLKKVLSTDKCVMLYTSFGTGFGLTNNDKAYWAEDDCSGVVALRALWKSYLQPKNGVQLPQVPVTPAMARYLTLAALVDRLIELGVEYVVLAIDEMNMLHDQNYTNFRNTIISLGNVMLNHFRNLYVVFAGVIHTPLKQVITKSLGIPVSISPSLFSLRDIEHILNESVASDPYLTNWQLAENFRRCIADLANPPRLFDFLMMEIKKQVEASKGTKDIFTLQYETFMNTVIEKAAAKTSADVDAAVAKFLINSCLTKKELQFYSIIPNSNGKTIEDVTREGYAYIENARSVLNVKLALPFFNLFTWLKIDASVFGCAEHLFKFTWNDPTAIGPMAWERFNVKYTSFKLTLLRNDQNASIPFETFHAGAMFGTECANYYVQPRLTVPVSYVDQFPASFDGNMKSDLLTPLVSATTRPTNLFEAVCLNGKNTPGIDAFYWLSDGVIEFQQYKANEVDSKHPTKLTQAELNAEYKKVEELFNAYMDTKKYKFVFGLVSNRMSEDELKLKQNMYVVHQGNMEEYYGPFASVAQVKGKGSVFDDFSH